MRVFGYGPELGRHIEAHGSSFTMSRLAHTDSCHVGCMYIPPGGGVGRHPASTPQLFVLISGDGWVTGQDGERVSIRAGEAAFWQAGEEHEARTDTGMTALVVEAEALTGLAGQIGPVTGHGGEG